MFDWNQGGWDNPEAGAAEWRMTVASDWAPMNRYEQVMLDDPAAVYGDLLPVLRRSDLNVVNIEAVLGEGGEPILKAGPHLSGDARAVAALTEANFTIGCLANNHIMDLGHKGLQSTRKHLTDAAIEPIGAGFDETEIRRPVIRRVKQTNVAIINCAEGESGRSVHGEPGVFGLDVPVVSRQIASLKATGQADVVVVIFHGGREHVPVPPPYVVRQLRQIAEAGADAVVAHHPHVPQAVEIHHGVPIAYSQGNFVFQTNSDRLYQRLGYLVHLDFAAKQLAAIRLSPYVLQEESLSMLSEPRRQWLWKQLAQAARPLDDEQAIVQAWSAVAQGLGLAPAIETLQHRIDLLQDPSSAGQAAAQLKNFFFTPAHAQLYCQLFTLAYADDQAQPPAWANQLLHEWAEHRVDF